ncbi:MAG: MBL fold metallo-hydrolase [Chloroflexi bacterium]|nr:MBL fold metallo-hydrolase [Chloroflexota bacterium]
MPNYEIWKIRSGSGNTDAAVPWMCYMPVIPMTGLRPKEDSVYCHFIEGNGLKVMYDCGRAGSAVVNVQYTKGRSSPKSDLEEWGGGGPEELRAVMKDQFGVDPDEVDYLVASHLHTAWTWNVEAFPNAQLIVHRQEILAAWDTQPSHRFGVSREHVMKVLCRKEPDHLLIIDGDHEIAPGLQVVYTAGHTPGHLSMVVQTKKGKAALLGELGFSYAHLYPGDMTILGPGLDKPLELGFAKGSHFAFGHNWDPTGEVKAIERLRGMCDLMVPTCDNGSPKMMPEQWWKTPSLEYQKYVAETYKTYSPGVYPDVRPLLERRRKRLARGGKKQK